MYNKRGGFSPLIFYLIWSYFNINILKYSKLLSLRERPPNKTVTQYWFSSRRLPFLTDLHNIWYKANKENGQRTKWTKILPHNISSSLKPIGLAHWCF